RMNQLEYGLAAIECGLEVDAGPLVGDALRMRRGAAAHARGNVLAGGRGLGEHPHPGMGWGGNEGRQQGEGDPGAGCHGVPFRAATGEAASIAAEAGKEQGPGVARALSGILVEPGRIELPTSSLRTTRSPS